jgi:hypothetical protein
MKKGWLPKLGPRDISMPRSISIAFGAKRTVSRIYEYAAC